MAFVLEFMERLLEKSTSACLEEYLFEDICVTKRKFLHVLRILFTPFFIVICPSVCWFPGNKIVYNIIWVYGKIVSLAEIGCNLAYEPGMQGTNLLPDGIIRKFQAVIGSEISF